MMQVEEQQQQRNIQMDVPNSNAWGKEKTSTNCCIHR